MLNADFAVRVGFSIAYMGVVVVDLMLDGGSTSNVGHTMVVRPAWNQAAIDSMEFSTVLAYG